MQKMWMAYSKSYGRVVNPDVDRTKVENAAKNFTSKNGFDDVVVYEAVSHAQAPVAPIELVPVTTTTA